MNNKDANTQKTIVSDELIYKNANTYRLHQDNLRWKLFIGVLAYYAIVLKFSSEFSLIEIVGLNLLGICYSFIVAVENFYYNLFVEHVDDCERRIDNNIKLITIYKFSNENFNKINTLHFSFIFAMLIIIVGNIALTYTHCSSCNISISLYVLNSVIFIVNVFFWNLSYRFILNPLKKVAERTNKI